MSWKGRPLPLDKFLRPVASDTRPRQTINDMQQEIVYGVVEANRPLQRLEAEELTDLVAEIAKSTDRAPWCIGATPCVLPKSRLHWRRQQRVLDARELSALQGIWTRYSVALESWCQSEKQSRVLMDLARNAFTSTVCCAVCSGGMVAIS